MEQVPLNEIGFGEQQEAAVGPFRTATVLVELGKDGDLAAGRIAFCELDGREVVGGFLGMDAVFYQPLEVGFGVL